MTRGQVTRGQVLLEADAKRALRKRLAKGTPPLFAYRRLDPAL